MNSKIKERLLKYQRDEVSSHILYQKFARREKKLHNKEVLQQIARDECRHAKILQHFTRETVLPNRWQIFWYTAMSYLLGYTFAIKLMEKNESFAARDYKMIEAEIPEVRQIVQDEERHELELLEILDEERLQYVGAMVLGLNDALVELSGTIAGLTFALANTELVALSGIITGVAATLSMAASNYLAEKADGNPNALKSSLYTGVAYLVTVALMVLPYLLYPHNMYVAALATMLTIVIAIIFFFNYYISVAKSLNFWRRFVEMAVISLGVAAISFVIGLLAKQLLGVDI